ncbi:MAG: hypothetical protein COT81_05680 [Candidatus Buchananbacteria bacterium CG10_big_fil_rev_8_21_14_0_10_42_9]|uniref:Uncharacterized protein n=1 Tax=Candidatus Buchananbacteria bacterium CG10_big_fil_rev_8_21_14_0_10_42_9 TaxID=1974526 RepID=A0A2H0W1Q7_9BACT|nr:MAG: hypothetical protein COT81_05680 [Candidatus Buchananbacteria bacterium CG10_big_fil_rev_8_21_14_0_10_42_9]
MKKIIGSLSGVAAFSLAGPVLAVDVGLNYATALGLGTRDIRETILAIIRAFFAFLGVLAILIVLYAGFMWMTAGGNEDKVASAKKMLAAGIIGLIIVLTSFAIATFVVDSIVNAL